MRFLKVLIFLLILIFSYNVKADLETLQAAEIMAPKDKNLVKALKEAKPVPVTVVLKTFNKTLTNYLSGENGGCWSCGIFDNIFNAANDIAKRLYNPLKNICIYLLAMGFSFYLLFKMVNYYISFGAIDPRNFFTELLRPFLYMIFAVILIVNVQGFYDYIITPITEMAISFAQQIVKTADVSGIVGEFKQYTSSLGESTVDALCGEGGFNEKIEFGLGEGAHDAMRCMIQKVSASVLVHMAVGATFMKDSFVGNFIFPKWNMLGVGLMIYICTFTIFIAFPFKLIDSIVRLAFVLSLLPLWIVCWVLPATRKYSAKAFEMFLHALVVFISLSACMVMIFHILEVSFTAMEAGGISKFMAHMQAGETRAAWKMTYVGGKFFSIYFALMVICFSLLKKIEGFASNFVGGSSNVGIGSSLEKTALTFAVQKPLSAIAKPAMNRIVEGATWTFGKGVGRGYQGVRGLFSKKDTSSSDSSEENGEKVNFNQSQRPSNNRRFEPSKPNTASGKTGSERPESSIGNSSKGRPVSPYGDKKTEKIGWRFWRLFKRKRNLEKPENKGKAGK